MWGSTLSQNLISILFRIFRATALKHIHIKKALALRHFFSKTQQSCGLGSTSFSSSNIIFLSIFFISRILIKYFCISAERNQPPFRDRIYVDKNGNKPDCYYTTKQFYLRTGGDIHSSSVSLETMSTKLSTFNQKKMKEKNEKRNH